MALRKIIIPVMLCSILASAIFIMSKVLAWYPVSNYPANTVTKANNSGVNTKGTAQVKVQKVAEGKKYSYIMLDPGHGGKDYGTVSGNLLEKNINLDIANHLKNSLTKNGYHVLMTRDKDVFLADKSNINGTLEKKDLDARTKLLNTSTASLFISLHVDSDPSQPLRNGSIVYYNPLINGSDKLAGILQKELNKVTVKGQKRTNNISSTADFYILKNTEIPGVLVETGFITNKHEKEGFLQEKFRADIATAIYNGITKYNSSQRLLAK